MESDFVAQSRDPVITYHKLSLLLHTSLTPPRPSKISEKNLSTKLKPFLTSHILYEEMHKL